MKEQLKVRSNDGKVSRAADGRVGPYSFWLGDLFEEDGLDGEDLGDDTETDQRSFGFHRS